jgi:hypothetical protein
MNISINTLRTIVASWVDDETVVGMHISRFIHSVVAGAQPPSRMSPVVSRRAVVIMRILRVRKAEVH